MIHRIASKYTGRPVRVWNLTLSLLVLMSVFIIHPATRALADGFNLSYGQSLTIEGATYYQTDYSYVGNYGAGTLTVSNGGQLINQKDSAKYLIIGSHAGSYGLAIVEGTDSYVENSVYVCVGYWSDSCGELHIRDGATVKATGWYWPCWIGKEADANGLVIVEGTGSEWQCQRLEVGSASGEGLPSLAVLSVVDGGLVEAIDVKVFASGELRGDGRIETPSIEVCGIIRPGDEGIGELTLDGTLSLLADSTLAVELGGAGADLLSVTGDATLDGALVIDIDQDFPPSVGSMWNVLEANAYTGQFASIVDADPDDGLDFAVVYGEHSVSIQVVPEPSCIVLLGIGVFCLARRRKR